MTKVINKMLIILSIVIIFVNNWVNNNFFFESFNQVLYTMTNSMNTASKDLIVSFVFNIINAIIVSIIIIIVLKLSNLLFKNKETYIKLEIKNKKYVFNIFNSKLAHRLKWLIPISIFFSTICYTLSNFYIIDFIKENYQYTSIYDEEYIEPSSVNITFPEEKRNLIYIYLESMETTYSSKSDGGIYNVNYIPELLKISKNNISFSDTNDFGGAYQARGASWTIASMIAYSTGIPYKTVFNSEEELENQETFLPGAYSIGEILKKEGYKNYLMVGSDSNFGNRKKFFESHGDYEIYDYFTAIEDKIITEDYYVFWGYEDKKLFEYAKDKLTKISKQEEPFNFTLLTVDTHANDGYLDESCEVLSDNNYLNAVACSSNEIYGFVQWVKKQPFYKDTTIVLVGDHISMNTYSFDDIESEERRVYNAIINSAINTTCTKKRIFNAFDYYPTTLASMGADIDGDRLGLGTNLFSCDKTLSEKYGSNYINSEIIKNSLYYTQCFHLNKCEK